jgi:RHS repeat-associated protein
MAPTPSVTYTYDTNYIRLVSMSDGIGTTTYSYVPITLTPTLGSGQLASEQQPFANVTITYDYNETGRRVSTGINGFSSYLSLDISGRIVGVTNALGAFTYLYDGSSHRMTSETYPNGLTAELAYGNDLQDHLLNRISYKVGATAVSEFIYGRDVPAGRITTWSQQSMTETPSVYSFGYDAGNELTSAIVSHGTSNVQSFSYSYDPADNRLTEQIDASTNQFSYNALNELTAQAGGSPSVVTNQWDAENRLASVACGPTNILFAYDGLGRRVGIRLLVNGAEVSSRRFVWCGNNVCEERSGTGSLIKRFFDQGMEVVTGPTAGSYYYTRDHLGSVRELTDSSGSVSARYSYDPFGRKSRLLGSLDVDFGFAGMFWTGEAGLNLTLFRAYDPIAGRWLSRDPLKMAEMLQGPNLYAYVGNNPVGSIDLLGLCCESEYWNLVAGWLCVGGAVVGGAAAATTVVATVGAVIAIASCGAWVKSAEIGYNTCMKGCSQCNRNFFK